MRYTSLLTIAGIIGLVLAAPGPSLSKRASSFVWFGANEAGAEFGSGNIPGELGTDYIWPSTSTIQTLQSAGMNIFRIPFAMERLVPGTMTSSADATYLASLKNTVNYITSNGGYAVVDPHNFGRYYGNIITSTSDFAAFWTTLASEFASNNKVIFDTNNEFNSEDQTLVLNLNQAAINAIRAAGAKSQYIFVEGNSWSGAWTWTTVNDNMKALTDPQDLIIYEMHQYLDSDGSGTSDTCVSSTIGRERVVAATQWLKDNGKKAFLGEFAGGANSVCQSAVTGMLDYLQANSDVWLGASWWSAGPWWGDYMYSFEPPSGVGYTYYMSLLKKYFPGSSGSGGTNTAVTTTSTTTVATTTTTGSSTTGAAHYAQCGGKNWSRATTCASPYTCQKQSDYYSQCL
ncbi:Glycoside hydrolase, superfamily [Penicillium italicum]|uniref:cellulase n=1 Tax=Penicillium italicum TaxID=40296 RepID=A0A0A2L4H6_PENIT|nr:Glycoside hydrolase, superfamily [Penicillium italicum]